MQEFDNLKDGEIIYKLVGPVLLKQEKFEADGTVKGRLEYIGGELYVPSPSDLLSFSHYVHSLLPVALRHSSLTSPITSTKQRLPLNPPLGEC